MNRYFGQGGTDLVCGIVTDVCATGSMQFATRMRRKDFLDDIVLQSFDIARARSKPGLASGVPADCVHK